MTLTTYKDYQELFTGLTFYNDCSLNASNQFQNIFDASVNYTTYSISKTDANRFGINNSFVFDAVNTDYIYNIAIPQPAFTICLWVNNLTATEGKIISKPAIGAANTNLTQISMTNNGAIDGYFASTYKIYSYTVNGNPYIPRNEWVLLTITYNAASPPFGMYVNKTPAIITQTYNEVSSVNTYFINMGAGYTAGAGSGSYLASAQMSVGEVFIFNRILSEQEIFTLYNLSKSKILYPLISPRGVE